ncbi:MAG: hypothetical protein ACI841_000921 [Planctomycetota bacterium]|jgi:hypothetical protein
MLAVLTLLAFAPLWAATLLAETPQSPIREALNRNPGIRLSGASMTLASPADGSEVSLSADLIHTASLGNER